MKRLCLWFAAASFLGGGALHAMAQDASDAIYDENTVATYRLTMAPSAWREIVNANDRDWQRAEMIWQGETVPGVGVKASGQGSLGVYEKQSIRLSFNEFEFANPAGPGTPGRKWRGVNRIKLRATGGGLNTRVACSVFRMAQVPASRACSAVLYVNGDLKGVYTVEEPIRPDFLRLRFGEDGGNLYNFKGRNDDYTERPLREAYNWHGSDPASYVPKYWWADTNYPGGDYSDVVALCDVLNNSSSPAEVRTRLSGIINVDGYLRHLAVETVYGEGDGVQSWGGGGGANNHFWYHRASTNRMEIIKWDSNASQGAEDNWWWRQNVGIPIGEVPIGYNYDALPHTIWIVRDSVAFDTLKSKVAQILDVVEPWIQGYLDRVADQLRGDVQADPYWTVNPGDFDDAVAYLKNWWSLRINYLRSQVGAGNGDTDGDGLPNSWEMLYFGNLGQTGSGDPDGDGRTNAQEYAAGTDPTVSNTTAADGAEFVSRSIPSTMSTGQSRTITVVMRNSGTTTWTAAGGYRLNSRGPYDNTTWGINRIPLAAGDSIAPGQQKTFTFAVTAPTTPGTYLSRWSMAVGGAAFGATTADVNVVVTGTPPPPGANDAQFDSQDVPGSMTAGRSYSVSVTMRNTGTTTWTEASQYRLMSRGPRGNTTWGINRAYLAPGDSVGPGQTATFSFTVTAPSTPGTYLSRWSMVQDGVDVFGQTTADTNVAVAGGGSTAGADGNDGTNFYDRCGGSIGATPGAALWWALGAAALLAGCAVTSTLKRPFAA